MQAAGIQLTSQQQSKIQAILAQARQDLLSVLSSDQQAKFATFAKASELSLMPLVLGQKASLTSSAAAGAQPCCAAKTAAQTVAQTTTTCPADCQKACCAAKTTTVAEQTTCPIMGSPIKKTVFTVYQGKKVYFCCPGCDKTFNKNPEKYTKNLPQF
jgi:YHS domain-containing protein